MQSLAPTRSPTLGDDRCSLLTDPAACAAAAGCGFCQSTWSCLPATAAGAVDASLIAPVSCDSTSNVCATPEGEKCVALIGEGKNCGGESVWRTSAPGVDPKYGDVAVPPFEWDLQCRNGGARFWDTTTKLGNGKCTCPSRVEGIRCDQCKADDACPGAQKCNRDGVIPVTQTSVVTISGACVACQEKLVGGRPGGPVQIHAEFQPGAGDGDANKVATVALLQARQFPLSDSDGDIDPAFLPGGNDRWPLLTPYIAKFVDLPCSVTRHLTGDGCPAKLFGEGASCTQISCEVSKADNIVQCPPKKYRGGAPMDYKCAGSGARLQALALADALNPFVFVCQEEKDAGVPFFCAIKAGALLSLNKDGNGIWFQAHSSACVDKVVKPEAPTLTWCERNEKPCRRLYYAGVLLVPLVPVLLCFLGHCCAVRRQAAFIADMRATRAAYAGEGDVEMTDSPLQTTGKKAAAMGDIEAGPGHTLQGYECINTPVVQQRKGFAGSLAARIGGGKEKLQSASTRGLLDSKRSANAGHAASLSMPPNLADRTSSDCDLAEGNGNGDAHARSRSAIEYSTLGWDGTTTRRNSKLTRALNSHRLFQRATDNREEQPTDDAAGAAKDPAAVPGENGGRGAEEPDDRPPTITAADRSVRVRMDTLRKEAAASEASALTARDDDGDARTEPVWLTVEDVRLAIGEAGYVARAKQEAARRAKGLVRRLVPWAGKKKQGAAAALSAGAKRVNILQGVTGAMGPGLTAIIGPSGCGKTTFIDVLAGRKSTGVLSGTVRVNGVPHSPAELNQRVGYVLQDEVLPGTATVREFLLFHAALRLPGSLSARARLERVEEVLRELRMDGYAEVRIGDRFKRGLSGGQKRRVSICVELLASRDVLLMDEPTSGLDSSSAKGVIDALGTVVAGGRTAVISIHQPPSVLFHQFDAVLLLSPLGETSFFGPQRDVLPFFAEQGRICPPGTNPAEFLLDLVSLPAPAKVAALAQAFGASDVAAAGRRRIEDTKAANSGAGGGNTAPTQRALAPAHVQFIAVAARCTATLARHKMLLLGNVLVSALIAAMSGIIYHGVDKNVTQSGIQIRAGVVFFVLVYFLLNALVSMSLWLEERALYLREHKANCYAPGPYLLAKVFFNFAPIQICSTIVYVAVSYFWVGLNPDPWRFLNHTLALGLANVAGACLMITIGTAFGKPAFAQLAGTFALLFTILMGGMLVNQKQLNEQNIGWISAFSYIHWAFEAMTYAEMHGMDMTLCGGEQLGKECVATTGDYILGDGFFGLNVPKDSKPDDTLDPVLSRDCGVLVAFSAVCIAVTYLLLKFWVKEQR